MATAPQKMKVKTLEGETLAIEVLPTNTVKELRAMLLESKRCEDSIERQLLRVEVLTAGLLIDDDQTVESQDEKLKRQRKKAFMKKALWESSFRPMSRKSKT